MAPRPIDVTIRGKNELKPAFDSAEQTAKSGVAKIKDAVVKPFEVIKGLVAVEAVRWFGDFAKSTVESAASAEAGWGRIESAVSNAGISFRGVRGDLDALFTKMQQTTRYSDDDAGDAFATLVNVSGDYSGSLKNLSVVADLAAAKQLDMTTAAQVVGKVMAGETGMLKRYGIVVKDGADAMQVMRDKFSGFAERDAATLEGRLHQIANGWDNVKEAVGRTLTGTSGDGLTALAQRLNEIGVWIDEHRHSFSDWALDFKLGARTIADALKGNPLSTWFRDHMKAGPGLDEFNARVDAMNNITDVTPDHGDAAYHNALAAERARNARKAQEEIDANRKQAARDAADRSAKAADDADKKHITQLKQEYDLLEKTAKLVGAKTSDYEKMAAIEGELTRLAYRGGGNAENRATAIDFVSGLRDKRQAETDRMDKVDADILGKGNPLAQFTPGSLIPDPTSQIYVRATAAQLPVSASASRASQFARGAQQSVIDHLGGDQAFSGIETSLGSLQNRLQDFTGNTLTSLFDVWQGGIQDIIREHNVLGRVIPQIMRKAAGAALQADAQDTFMRAMKAAALGLTNPVNLLQAGKLFAIGTAELGAAAALSGGGGGGGYSGGGGISAGGFQQSQNDVGGKGKATVILKGKSIDFTDPESLSSLAAAIRELGVTRELEFIVGGD